MLCASSFLIPKSLVPLSQNDKNGTFFMEEMYKNCTKNSMVVTIAVSAFNIVEYLQEVMKTFSVMFSAFSQGKGRKSL